MDLDRLLAAVLVVAAGGFSLAVAVGGHDPVDAGEPVDELELVRPVENGSWVWPHTSRTRSVGDRTLAVNLVVAGEPTVVRRLLTDRTPNEWQPAPNDTRAVVDVDGVRWSQARGSPRYTYTRPPDGEGRWVTASYQLATGDYLGTRVHVRAYPAPEGEWTALQAHEEYWDWFRLRHTVTGVATAGQFVVADLQDVPAVAEVRRLVHGQEGGGSDGWLSIVEVALATLLLGGLVGGRRPTDRGISRAVHRVGTVLPPAAGLAALVLGVRVAGMGLESAFPGLDPRMFAIVLYPALAAGVPLLVWRLAPTYRPTDAFAGAVLGLGVGVVVDFWSLGVTSIPPRLLLHRIGLVVAIGVVAAGCARPDRTGRWQRWIGLAAWAAVLALPLAGMI